MFLKKEKESRVSTNRPLSNCALQLAPVKPKMFYLHARLTLANFSSDYKHLTPNHTISFQNFLIIIHSLNRGLAVRNPYVQNMP